MKKTFKIYTAIVICTLTIMLVSCSDNKIDKMQKEELKVLNMIIKDIQESDVSQDAIDALKTEAPKFQEAIEMLETVRKEKVNLSDKQKQRAAEINGKMTVLALDRRATPYLRLVIPM